MAKGNTKNKEDSDKKLKCPSCGAEKLIDRGFYKSDSIKYKSYDSRCFICKACLKNKCFSDKGLFDKDLFKSVLKDDLDKPFYEKLYQQALQDDKDTLGKYLSLLNLSKKNNVFWKDGETEEKELQLKNKNAILSLDSEDISKEQLYKWQMKWGEDGFTIKDYRYLDEQYNDLCHNYRSDDSYAMQLIFEESCHTRLIIKKKRERGEDVNKDMKTLQDLLGSANIKPNQETSAGNIEKGSFGMFIKKIESEEPIPRWVEDLGEEDKMWKYINTFFFGNLARVLNIKNPWEEDFNKEMAQYTVEISEVEKDEDIEDLLSGEKV